MWRPTSFGRDRRSSRFSTINRTNGMSVSHSGVLLNRFVTRGRPAEEEFLLASVPRQAGRALEFPSGFLQPAEFDEQVAANTRQEMIALQGRVVRHGIDQVEARLWTGR